MKLLFCGTASCTLDLDPNEFIGLSRLTIGSLVTEMLAEHDSSVDWDERDVIEAVDHLYGA